MPDKINVMLVDDHQMIRDGIKYFLEKEDDVQVVAEASSGEEALEVLKTVPVDIVVLDINMKKMSGIECARKIKSEYDNINVIALTMLDDEQYIKFMLDAGASAYVLKNNGKEELLKAIEAVSKGGHYFSAEVTDIVMSNMVKQEKKIITTGTPLTEREKEVLQLIMDEYTNAEIADKLFLSVRTVDAHRRNLLEKTGAKNTAGLVKYTLQHNLLNQQ